MNTNRYCFSNFIEDDDLSIMAVLAKEVMQQNVNITRMFQINNEILYGHSPRQVLFLRKQNNKSLFSTRSSNDTSPSDAKSHEGISTPIRWNTDTSNMPRRYLPLDDTEKNAYPSSTLGLRFSFRGQRGRVQPTATIVRPIDEPSTSYEQSDSSISSTCSSEADSQESPRSAQIAKMTENLTMAEKEFGSPKNGVGSNGECSQGSPCSDEVSMLTARLAMEEKEFGSMEKGVGNIEQRNQVSPRSAEIIRMTSSLNMDDKDSRNLVLDVRNAGYFAVNRDSPNPEENVGESENTALNNKYYISHSKGIQTSNSSKIGSETPSPVKRSKVSSISNFDIHEFDSPSEKSGENSPESTETTVSPLQRDKFNTSPNETFIEIDRYDRKRKSLSPRKRSTVPFRSIPRVIQLAGEKEIDIEVVDLDNYVSPKTPRSKSADYRSDSIKDSFKSHAVDESKTETSPKNPERFVSPSERASVIVFSRNAKETTSPESCDYVFVEKNPSDNPSIVATPTRDQSCKSAPSSAEIETDPVSLKETILKFNTLLALREQFVRSSFGSLHSLQSSISSMHPYIHNIGYILTKIYISGRYLEFNETVIDAIAIAQKLMKKLEAWKKDIENDVETWKICFQQIEQLKAQYEPLLTNEGKPAVTCEVAHVYESKMKAIWKKIDDMIMLGDSRRALFSHIAHDVERLIKMFTKCLILVGILQPR